VAQEVCMLYLNCMGWAPETAKIIEDLKKIPFKLSILFDALKNAADHTNLRIVHYFIYKV